jgi:hypothetical protein
MDNGKNLDFPAKSPTPRPPASQIGSNPDPDADDLTVLELPRLNSFSNPRLHSEA